MNYDPSAVGPRLKRIRENMGTSQYVLASDLGISPQTLESYENGRTYPNIIVLTRACELFNCDIGYLFGERTKRKKSRL